MLGFPISIFVFYYFVRFSDSIFAFYEMSMFHRSITFAWETYQNHRNQNLFQFYPKNPVIPTFKSQVMFTCHSHLQVPFFFMKWCVCMCCQNDLGVVFLYFSKSCRRSHLEKLDEKIGWDWMKSPDTWKATWKSPKTWAARVLDRFAKSFFFNFFWYRVFMCFKNDLGVIYLYLTTIPGSLFQKKNVTQPRVPSHHHFFQVFLASPRSSVFYLWVLSLAQVPRHQNQV